MKKNSIILAFLVLSISLYSQQFLLTIPDSSSVRRQLVNEWFTENINILRGREAQVLTAEDGTKFQVRFEEYGGECAIIVAPEKLETIDSYSDAGLQTYTRPGYPQGEPGCWILYRNSTTGKPLCVRYFFSADSGVFVQFRPTNSSANGKTLADYVVFGMYGAKNVSVGIDFDRLYVSSIKDIYSLTKKTLPWYDNPFYSGLYDPITQMSSIIRESLPRFVYIENVAYNDEKELVTIHDEEPYPIDDFSDEALYVSSAGFIKWIADGISVTKAGSGLLISPLKTETVFPVSTSLSYAKNQEHDLFFSLNWTRNIATAIVSIYTNHNYTYETSGVNVQIEPFAGIYSENVGYTLESVKPLLYHLAATEPGNFYLGALRHTIKSEEGLEFAVYSDSVAFFPYFDEKGKFGLSIFEDGLEISFENFLRIHEKDFVQLVRINATSRFYPQ